MENRTRTQVHMLPTEDKSDIIENNSLDFIYHSSHKDYSHWGVEESKHLSYQHLYFTSDEEIKEGDWFINTNFQKIYQANSENSKNIIEFGPHPEIRKIIATTDPKLTVHFEGHEYGTAREINAEVYLPQPSQDFIKAYCKQGGIDEVDVEYEEEGRFAYTGDTRYIPKVDTVHNTITTHRIVEKMYSIDDIEAYCDKYPNDTELGREIRKLRYKQ